MPMTHQESRVSFFKQIQFAHDHYKNHGLNASSFQNIVIAGLGGSGIGGKLTKSFYFNEFPLPVEVVSDYTLPAFANEKTLLILGSYSGNTEETLSVYEQGKAKNCKMIVVSAGGQLTEWAQKDGIQIYSIETGFQPRMALGYSFTYLLKIFAELINKNIDDQLLASIEALSDQSYLKDMSQSLQKKFQGHINKKYVIVSDAALEGVAIRFCQQLNENSKVEAFWHLLPEANNNVIESYYGKLDTNFIFLNSDSHERVSERFDFLRSLLEKENNRVAEISIEEVDIPSIYLLIHQLDWFTIDITEPLNVDPMLIDNIISLKDYLSA